MEAFKQQGDLASALGKFYETAKSDYMKIKEKVEEGEYEKALAAAQETATNMVAEFTTGQEAAAAKIQHVVDPESKYQSDRWFTSLPPKKNLMHKVFSEMDREKGIRTTGKVRIDYVDRTTGQNVTMYVWPSSLKYLSKWNPADNSKALQVGNEIQSVQNQKPWGKLVSRKPENDGWVLDNGKSVFDSTHGVTWEIKTLVMGRDTVQDGDGVDIFGDYDSLWFKTAPPQTDEGAYQLYTEVDPQKSISTDGFYRGGIALIYYDKEGDIGMGYYDIGIIKYMTQQNPNMAASKTLRPGTAIRSKIDQKSWGTLTTRKPEDDGWNLDNGRHVLDATYNTKWEVATPVVEEDVE